MHEFSHIARPDEFGECDPTNGKIPGANGFKDGLLSLQGTSMATPLTAGHASLIRQYFEEGYYPNGIKGDGRSLTNPSATLIKGVLMNGAQVNIFSLYSSVSLFEEMMLTMMLHYCCWCRI